MALTFKRWLALLVVGIAPAAIAAPCLPGTLADYMALAGGCEIGTTTFTGFGLLADLPPGSTPIASTAITVTPVVSVANPGLTFGLGLSAAANEVLATLIHFQALAGLASSLTGASIAIAGAQAAGDGVALMIEDLCAGGAFATPPTGCSGTPLTMLALATELDSQLLDSVSFAGVSLADVVVNFVIDGGLAGSAALAGGTVRFSTDAVAVPAPGTLLLALVALLALAATRRATLLPIR